MSVNIKFEPAGITGVVAEGTYLWDAAKRIGMRLPAECGGRGECDTCAIVIEKGATLLSSLTNAERVRLSPERLAAGERLACQTKILYSGDLQVRPVPVTEREETTAETVSDFRSDFKSLPLKKKLATLVELEAHTMFETLNTFVEVPISAGEKFMNMMARKGRAMSKHDRDEHRPAEHREEDAVSPEEKES